MTLEQFLAIIAMCTAIGTLIGSGLAAFFNNRRLAPIRNQATEAHSTATGAARDFADLRTRYERLDREFINFRLEASYNRGKQEAEIAHLREQLAKQNREIEGLKRQRDDLMRLLIVEREKVQQLKERIQSLENERDETARKLAHAIALTASLPKEIAA